LRPSFRSLPDTYSSLTPPLFGRIVVSNHAVNTELRGQTKQKEGAESEDSELLFWLRKASHRELWIPCAHLHFACHSRKCELC
jgi:hypothetical protein